MVKLMQVLAVMVLVAGSCACGGSPVSGLSAAELECLSIGQQWDSGPVNAGWVRIVGPTGGITQVPKGACLAQWEEMGWGPGE
jgi:hypothetical protein